MGDVSLEGTRIQEDKDSRIREDKGLQNEVLQAFVLLICAIGALERSVSEARGGAVKLGYSYLNSLSHLTTLRYRFFSCFAFKNRTLRGPVVCYWGGQRPAKRSFAGLCPFKKYSPGPRA